MAGQTAVFVVVLAACRLCVWLLVPGLEEVELVVEVELFSPVLVELVAQRQDEVELLVVAEQVVDGLDEVVVGLAS